MSSTGSVSENELLDLEVDPVQWDVIEEDGVFAWNAPDGSRLVHPNSGEEELSARSDELAMPPERVRFTTLVNIKEVGAKAYFEGVLVNISTEGVGCVSAHRMAAGARVWITFRLGLLEPPLSLLCEVVWERRPELGDPSYGFKFIEITPDEVNRIDELVQERSEGRAGEWPLPVLPSKDEGTPSRVSPWMFGLMGALLGAGLAFVVSQPGVSALVSASGAAFGLSENGVEARSVELAEERALLADFEAAVNQEQEVVEPKIADPAPVAPEPSLKKPALVAPEPSLKQPALVAPVVVSKAPSKASVEPPKSVMTVSGSELIANPASKEVTLELQTTGPVSTYKSFWLSKPRRLVVDVPANQSGFSQLLYSVKHPLVERLRIGPYQDKVRFVLELSEAATGKLSVSEGRLHALVMAR